MPAARLVAKVVAWRERRFRLAVPRLRRPVDVAKRLRQHLLLCVAQDMSSPYRDPAPPVTISIRRRPWWRTLAWRLALLLSDRVERRLWSRLRYQRAQINRELTHGFHERMGRAAGHLADAGAILKRPPPPEPFGPPREVLE